MPGNFMNTNWGSPQNGMNPLNPGYYPDTMEAMSSWGSPPQANIALPTANFDNLTAPSAAPSFLQKLMGYSSKDPSGAMVQNPGFGVPALGAASALMNAFMGMKQYGLYKDQLSESKKQFALNYDAQRQTTNTALQDRQAARVASNPGAYQSVGTYMASNAIPGR